MLYLAQFSGLGKIAGPIRVPIPREMRPARAFGRRLEGLGDRESVRRSGGRGQIRR
jgi:hypothetical protein